MKGKQYQVAYKKQEITDKYGKKYTEGILCAGIADYPGIGFYIIKYDGA